jgi:hypothetical protein
MYCSDVCTAVMSTNLRTCEGGEWGRKKHTYIYTHTHTHRILAGKSEGKRQLGRLRYRWKANINGS